MLNSDQEEDTLQNPAKSSLQEARLLMHLAGFTMKEASVIKTVLGLEEAILDVKGSSDLIAAGIKRRSIDKLLNILGRRDHLRETERLKGFGAKILIHGFPGYPSLLQKIPWAPPALFLKGHLPSEGVPVLAMIGSRRCTPEGRRLSRFFGKQMALQGIAVVSGMARGIDAASIQGCIENNGIGIGVLGCGLDRVYPPENSQLFLDTLHSGALISEFPLGSSPLKRNFPRRNRIISGLARGVLVVEASKKSGSLITVDHAMDQNKTVLAIPGPVGPPHFEGSNTLIRDGACVVLEPEDILAALHLPILTPSSASMKHHAFQNPTTAKILRVCLHKASTLERVTLKTGLPQEEILRRVSRLEMEGFLERLPGARFLTKEPYQRARARK